MNIYIALNAINGKKRRKEDEFKFCFIKKFL